MIVGGHFKNIHMDHIELQFRLIEKASESLLVGNQSYEHRKRMCRTR